MKTTHTKFFMKKLYKKKRKKKGREERRKKGGGKNEHTYITILSLGRAGRGMQRKTT